LAQLIFVRLISMSWVLGEMEPFFLELDQKHGLDFRQRQFCPWSAVDTSKRFDELNHDILLDLGFIPDNGKGCSVMTFISGNK
jgi:hypothetical protein